MAIDTLQDLMSALGTLGPSLWMPPVVSGAPDLPEWQGSVGTFSGLEEAEAEVVSGSLVLGGSAGLVLAGTASYTGGLVLGGSAAPVLAGTARYTAGLVLSGSAALVLAGSTVGRGPLVLGGSAGLVLAGTASYTGGLALGGSAALVLTPGEVQAATFLKALRDHLRGRPELAALTDVYLTAASSRAVLPYLIVKRLYQVPYLSLGGGHYREVGIQLTLLTADDIEGERLGERAFESLYPRPGTRGLVFGEGYEMSRVPGGSIRGPDEQPAGKINGKAVWSYSFDYNFLIGRP